MSLNQNLHPQGMVRAEEWGTVQAESEWNPLLPRPPFHAYQALGNRVPQGANPIVLVSFLAARHVKIDVSVIFTISRETAKFPAGPGVGADVVRVHLLFSH